MNPEFESTDGKAGARIGRSSIRRECDGGPIQALATGFVSVPMPVIVIETVSPFSKVK